MILSVITFLLAKTSCLCKFILSFYWYFPIHKLFKWYLSATTYSVVMADLHAGNSWLSGGGLTSLWINCGFPPLTTMDSKKTVNQAWFAIILWQQHVRVGVCHSKTGWGIVRQKPLISLCEWLVLCSCTIIVFYYSTSTVLDDMVCS
jgi:hypothetical protein